MIKEKGNVLIIVLGVVLVLVLIGGVVYFTQFHNQPLKDSPHIPQASSLEMETASPSASVNNGAWKTYTDNTLHVNLQYPQTWDLAPSTDALGKYIVQITNSQSGDIITINANWGTYQSVAKAFAAYTHNIQPIPIEVAGHSALKYEPQNDRQNNGTHIRSVFFTNQHNQIIQISLESKEIQAVGPTFKQFLSLIQDTN